MFGRYFYHVLLTRAYVLITIAFALHRRGFAKVDFWHVLLCFLIAMFPRAPELLTRGYELLTRGQELQTRGHELLTRGYELLKRGHVLM